MGLVRLRVFSHYFGLSDVADAFNAAFRIPNLLQNLFGEGVLSASFIPVYARLLAKGEIAESRRVASAVAAILLLITSTLVILGVLATPFLIDLIAPGFHGSKRQLTVELVRILFLGAGLLVLSAWCLGVLNSHRRFFMSYAAPVIWNVAMIATLLLLGSHTPPTELVVYLAWGSVLGSLLQVGIQLPAVVRLLGGISLNLELSEQVRRVLRSFVPVFISRGVVQISAYVDSILASLLPAGAVAGLANAQLLYTLPISLFGMSVSAAELPVMSSATGTEAQVAAYLCDRLNSGLRRIAFFVVPCSITFLAFGDLIAAALMQSGRFTHENSIYVWAILAGSTVGLLASTMGRLYSSTYYALRDTRTPLRYAITRVLLTSSLGYLCAFPLPRVLGIEPRWGVVGLTASAGVAGWIEFALLRRTLNRRIGSTGLATSLSLRLWLAGASGAVIAWTAKLAAPLQTPIPLAAAVLSLYGAVYFIVTYLLRVDQARSIAALLRSRLRL